MRAERLPKGLCAEAWRRMRLPDTYVCGLASAKMLWHGAANVVDGGAQPHSSVQRKVAAEADRQSSSGQYTQKQSGGALAGDRLLHLCLQLVQAVHKL